jgi:hypothetical protein
MAFCIFASGLAVCCPNAATVGIKIRMQASRIRRVAFFIDSTSFFA